MLFRSLKDPYGTSLLFGAGYAPRENKYVANLRYEIRDLVPAVRGSFTVDYSGIETLHFYGFGNDTEDTESRQFYKLRRGRLLVERDADSRLHHRRHLGTD